MNTQKRYICKKCNQIIKINSDETVPSKCHKCGGELEYWGDTESKSTIKDEQKQLDKIDLINNELNYVKKDIHSIYKMIKFFTIVFIVDTILLLFYYIITLFQSGIIM